MANLTVFHAQRDRKHQLALINKGHFPIMTKLSGALAGRRSHHARQLSSPALDSKRRVRFSEVQVQAAATVSIQSYTALLLHWS